MDEGRVLRSPVFVSQPWGDEDGEPQPELKEFVGIWDTGATTTAVTPRVVDECGLVQVGETIVRVVDDSEDRAEPKPVYLAHVMLPNDIAAPLRVAAVKIHGGDVLIGMDIISAGDFLFSGQGSGSFSFRHPPGEKIDWVAEQKQAEYIESQKQRGQRPRRRRR